MGTRETLSVKYLPYRREDFEYDTKEPHKKKAKYGGARL